MWWRPLYRKVEEQTIWKEGNTLEMESEDEHQRRANKAGRLNEVCKYVLTQKVMTISGLVAEKHKEGGTRLECLDRLFFFFFLFFSLSCCLELAWVEWESRLW